MGLTNISSAAKLLKYAGRDSGVLVTFGGDQKALLVGNVGIRDFHEFEASLHQRTNVWLHAATGDLGPAAGPAPNPAPCPSLRLASSLKPLKHWAKAPSRSAYFAESNLAFVLVVRGNEGALINKTRILYDREMAAMACIEEALNGYSVVFSGAILAADIHSLRSPDAACLQLDADGGLDEVEKYYIRRRTGETGIIPVWC